MKLRTVPPSSDDPILQLCAENPDPTVLNRLLDAETPLLADNGYLIADTEQRTALHFLTAHHPENKKQQTAILSCLDLILPHCNSREILSMCATPDEQPQANDVVTQFRYTPIGQALVNGTKEIVTKLYEKLIVGQDEVEQASIDQQIPSWLGIFLQIAASALNESTMSFLTTKVALNHPLTTNGEHILHLVAKLPTHLLHNHVELISFLIENGADINAQDNDGNTPLMVLCQHLTQPVTHIIKEFIKRGAKPNLTNAQLQTALHILLQDSLYISLAGDLRKAMDNPFSVDKDGRNVFHYAARRDVFSINEIGLLSQFIDIEQLNSKDNFGKTFLHYLTETPEKPGTNPDLIIQNLEFYFKLESFNLLLQDNEGNYPLQHIDQLNDQVVDAFIKKTLRGKQLVAKRLQDAVSAAQSEKQQKQANASGRAKLHDKFKKLDKSYRQSISGLHTAMQTVDEFGCFTTMTAALINHLNGANRTGFKGRTQRSCGENSTDYHILKQIHADPLFRRILNLPKELPSPKKNENALKKLRIDVCNQLQEFVISEQELQMLAGPEQTLAEYN